MNLTYHPRRVFAAACLGLLLFGIVLTTLGTVLPSITERFDLARTDAGSLFSLMSLGIVVASVVFGPIVDRYGYRWLLTASAALVLLGLLGVAFAPAFGILAPAVLVTGFGGGIINGATNALVADVSTDNRSGGLNLLGVFFGIGAFGLPLTLGLLIDSLGYTGVLAIMTVPIAFVLIFFLTIHFPAPKQPHGFPLRDALRIARDPVTLLFGAILFFQSGLEITVGGWTATFVGEVLGVRPEHAMFFLSLYWAGMTSARLLLGTRFAHIATPRALLPCMAVALAGALLLITARSVIPAAIGVFITGAGFAGVFPIVLGMVGDRHPDLSGTAFSLVLVVATGGGAFMPLLTGALADAFGLRLALLVVPGALIAAAATYQLPVLRRQRAGVAPVRL